MSRMTENDKRELEVGLGPLGTGIYYLWNLFAPSEEEIRRRAREQSGPELSGWCLAYNQDDDLVFLRTNGYYGGYFIVHAAPGGAHFVLTGFSVKSRESDSQFMVMRRAVISDLGGDKSCSRDDMVEWARRWSGYEVTGEEKEYYLALINAANNREGDEV
ncbi:hypothetical protein VTI28DRAFT_8680 [Corynascus sepedonium]